MEFHGGGRLTKDLIEAETVLLSSIEVSVNREEVMKGVSGLLQQMNMLRERLEEGVRRYNQPNNVVSWDLAMVKSTVWEEKRRLILGKIRTLNIQKEVWVEVKRLRLMNIRD